MIKTVYFELIVSLAIVLGTLLTIALIRLILKRTGCSWTKPPLDMKVYYGSDCECFEILLEKLINSGAVRNFKVTLIVVDTEKTEESAQWLESLQKKLGFIFDIA